MLAQAVVALCVVLILQSLTSSAIRLRHAFASLGTCPGRNVLWTHPFDTLGLALLPIFPTKGQFGNFSARFSHYAKEGSTILGSVVFWSATPCFWIADAQALKAVTSDRHTFIKDVANYDRAEIYGKNVVTVEGNEWRRHVAVAGPAFSEANYTLTWKEALRITNEWVSDELQKSENLCRVDVNAKMTQATLHVIASAGFGFYAPWSAFRSDTKDEKTRNKDDILPFHTSLQWSLEKLLFHVLIPNSVQNSPISIPWLSKQITAMRHAFSSLEVHMRNLVEDIRREDGIKHEADEESEQADLLRRLVKANDVTRIGKVDEGTLMKRSLTDSELFSNIFIFLLAGHETSAHTLAYAIVLLALYPDVQRKLREETLRIWPTIHDMQSSTFRRDFDKFEYTLAFFRETLRCFPTEPRLLKIVTSDVVLQGSRFSPAPGSKVTTPVTSFDGDESNVHFVPDSSREKRFSVTLPKDSLVIMDIWGLHMNPLVWGEDAHMFRPERFIDTEDYKWPRDGFLAFSAGARGCIGHRFATAESICILASLVRRFEVLPNKDLKSLKSREAMKRHMLKTWPALTITPANAIVQLRPYENPV